MPPFGWCVITAAPCSSTRRRTRRGRSCQGLPNFRFGDGVRGDVLDREEVRLAVLSRPGLERLQRCIEVSRGFSVKFQVRVNFWHDFVLAAIAADFEGGGVLFFWDSAKISFVLSLIRIFRD